MPRLPRARSHSCAAIYCCDGRVGEHFDDFLTNGLQLPHYDRIALPGGPACLASHNETLAPTIIVRQTFPAPAITTLRIVPL